MQQKQQKNKLHFFEMQQKKICSKNYVSKTKKW